MNHAELAEMAEWAYARLPRLTDDVYARIVESIELYRTDHLVPRADLRSSIEHSPRYIVAAIADPNAPAIWLPQKNPAIGERTRAWPVPEVLRAARIGFATLWDALVEHAGRGSDPPTAAALLAATSTIWQLTDEHALALTASYRVATAELLTAQQRRHSALVEALLTGHPGVEGGPWEAAALLGLPGLPQLMGIFGLDR